jgi:uncharacterized protein (DUF2336 family)
MRRLTRGDTTTPASIAKPVERPSMQLSEHSVIGDLEEAMRTGSSEKRVNTLRQVTNLFLHDGERLSDEQIKVFDDVLCILISKVETRAKAELSKTLAPVDYAPTELVRRLAGDDESTVAEHVLTHSRQLTTGTLVNVASTKGQDHLYAISGRADLPEAVTDIIVNRGERRVIHHLASNTTARFSESGYAGMVAHAEADDQLTEILGLRIDLPVAFLRDLLRRAAEAVRARLMAVAPPALQEEIKRVLATIANTAVGHAPKARDFTRAEQIVKRMKGLNELTDTAIASFAETKRFNEVSAALAIQNNVPTEMMAKVIEGPRHDLVLIPCKSAELNWPAVAAILTSRPVKHAIDEQTLKIACSDYGRLSVETARRTLRFWQVHDKIEK